MHFLIYQLCDGDISRRKEVEEMNYVEAVEWIQLAKFEQYVQSKEKS